MPPTSEEREALEAEWNRLSGRMGQLARKLHKRPKFVYCQGCGAVVQTR